MSDFNYIISNPIIASLSSAKKDILTKHSEDIESFIFEFDYEYFGMTDFEEILNEINNKKNELILNTTKENGKFVENFINNELQINYENRKTGKLFNPLSFFGIGETMHSFLLSFLLNPYAEHGHEKLFLKEFLKLLNIEVNETDHWIVTAEEGRIDILLKRIEPKTIVVIENKSNFAIDQQNQLYRYWYQEIYYPNSYRNDVLEFTTQSGNFQIIYLTPADWKVPSDNTFEKPSWLEDEKLPSILPIKPKILMFSEHVVNWLNACLPQINPTNHRLREFVKQYIELWT